MSRCKILIFVLLLFFFFNCANKKNTIYYTHSCKVDDVFFKPIPFSDSISKNRKAIRGTFKIEKITKQKKAYIIEVTNDSIYDLTKSYYYTIICSRTKNKSYSKVKKGREYQMTLYPFFQNDCIRLGFIFGININDSYALIKQLKGINIYTTPDLDGLYYMDGGVEIPRSPEVVE